MKPVNLSAWAAAITMWAAVGSPAQAAWNNVFQVCCNNCTTPAPVIAGYSTPVIAAYAPPVVAAYGDACPPPCPPQKICTTRYVQRTYYEPVVTYKQECFTEAVTTYQTRYVQEAFTSYRYTCAYNPCTCRYEQVAQPVTSFRLRAQCCPVTSYLQRTRMVPVMSQRAVTMYEPVTSCCTTSVGPAVMAPPAGASIEQEGSSPGGAERRDPVPSTLPPAPPGTESREPAPDRTPMYTPPPTMPHSTGSGFRQAPTARFDRMASQENSVVQGRLTDRDRLPRANTRVLFVSAAEKSEQYQTTTDADGIFRTRLDKGGWLVYTFDSNGKPVYNRRIDVASTKAVTFTLVSR
jgi:hypothetical protein